MRRLMCFISLGLMFLPSFIWAGLISGHVFIDANGDGQYQPGETPVPEALVSDGLTIVAPQSNGAYQLQAPEGLQVVFLINPSGTWPTAGFYRIMPTGEGQADFPLRQEEQRNPFYFVHGTDLHIYDTCAAQMAQYVKTLNELPVPLAFVIHTGDLVRDAARTTIAEGERLLKLYQQMTAGIKAPLFNLPGNHEHAGMANPDVPPTDPDRGKSLYRRLLGPCYYAFNYGGVGFIALDGTDISSGRIVYRIPQECMNWLHAYLSHLSPSVPLVFAIHEPLFSMPEQKAEIEQLLAGRKTLLAISGHGHSLRREPFAGGWETEGGIVGYAWHGSGYGPNAIAYHLVKITEDGFEDAMGDWAEKYPVTVASPARTQILSGEAACEIRFLDLKNEVNAVEIRLGSAQRTITQFQPSGLARAFSCVLQFPDITDGVYELTMILHGVGEPMIERQPFVVLTGKEEPFTAEGPAQLSMRLYGVQAAHIIKVNGQELARLPADAQEQQLFRVNIPAALLKRLNVVEFVSVPLANGRYDGFEMRYVTMTYQGRSLHDPRLNNILIPASDKPQSRVMYFDIKKQE